MFSLFSFHKLKKKKGFRTDFYGTNIIQCLKFMYFINAPGLKHRNGQGTKLILGGWKLQHDIIQFQ